MDALLNDLVPARAPTMGQVAKMNYTHVDLIDFIIANPGITQNALAARYGYTPSWISNVMASDAFQSLMAKRRGEMVDPTLAATINERFHALADRSLTRLMERLDAPAVSDNVILKAVELGAKAIGVGGNASPPGPQADHLAQLANRLIDLQSTIRKGVVLEGQVIEVSPEQAIEIACGPDAADPGEAAAATLPASAA